MIDHDTARELLPDFALDLLVHDEAGDVLDHLRACDVCLAETQLYLHGARALSIAISRSPQAISLRTSVPQLPDGALARIRDRVLDIAPDEAEPTRRLVFARPQFVGAQAVSRIFGRGGRATGGGSDTGMSSETAGGLAAAVPEEDEDDYFETDSFFQLAPSTARPLATPAIPLEPAPGDDDGEFDWLLGPQDDPAPANAPVERQLTLGTETPPLAGRTEETAQAALPAFEFDELLGELPGAADAEESLRLVARVEQPTRPRRFFGRRERDERDRAAAEADPSSPPTEPAPTDSLDPVGDLRIEPVPDDWDEEKPTRRRRRFFGRERGHRSDAGVAAITPPAPLDESPPDSPLDVLAAADVADPESPQKRRRRFFGRRQRAEDTAATDSAVDELISPPSDEPGLAPGIAEDRRWFGQKLGQSEQPGGTSGAPTPGHPSAEVAAPEESAAPTPMTVDDLLAGIAPEDDLDVALPAEPSDDRAHRRFRRRHNRPSGGERPPAPPVEPEATPKERRAPSPPGPSGTGDRRRGALRRRLGREPEPTGFDEDDFTTDLFGDETLSSSAVGASELELRPVALATGPSIGVAPAPGTARTLPRSPIPGLGGYYDDDIDGERAARPAQDDEADDDDEDDEDRVGAGWRSVALIAILLLVVALGGLGFTFYSLLSSQRALNTLEARVPSYALQVSLKGTDIQGVGYFADNYARGLLAIDGVKPAQQGSRIILWSVSTKDGIKPVLTLIPDRVGARTYVEVRRLPKDVLRIFATIEPAGRTLPTVPTGGEVFTGKAPFTPEP